MQEVFKKEVTFLSQQFDAEKEGFQQVELTKTATFKELSRLDSTQVKLHWRIMDMVKQDVDSDEDENGTKQLKVNPDSICDLVYKFVKLMTVCNDEFSEENKRELLADSGAMLKLGMWLLSEKIQPFFLKLM